MTLEAKHGSQKRVIRTPVGELRVISLVLKERQRFIFLSKRHNSYDRLMTEGTEERRLANLLSAIDRVLGTIPGRCRVPFGFACTLCKQSEAEGVDVHPALERRDSRQCEADVFGRLQELADEDDAWFANGKRGKRPFPAFLPTLARAGRRR